MFIWGDKTLALFDVWSIEHLVSGIFWGALISSRTVDALKKLPKPYRWRYHFYKVMFFAFLWEALEHYLEIGLLGNNVSHWFQGVEYWANRLVTDPLLMLLGYYIVQHYTKIALPARIFSAIWLFFHFVVFPHSMYLHHA